MLSVRECAERACVCESLVRSWLASGQLPHYRLGAKGKRGKIVVSVEDLDGLLASFKVERQASLPAPRSQPVKLKHLHQPS